MPWLHSSCWDLNFLKLRKADPNEEVSSLLKLMVPDLLYRAFPKGVTYQYIIPPPTKPCSDFDTVPYAKHTFQEPPFLKIICMLSHTPCNNFCHNCSQLWSSHLYWKFKNGWKTEDDHEALLAFGIPLTTLWKWLERYFSPLPFCSLDQTL